MATVYRVENQEGLGPYRAFALGASEYGLNFDAVWLRGHNDNDHPTPSEEGISFYHPDAQCGFESLEKLGDWFTDDELVVLASYGFRIMEIEAKWVKYGKKQCVFHGVTSSKVFLEATDKAA